VTLMDVRHLQGESASTPENGALATLTLRQHLMMNVLWFAQNFQSAALLPIVIPVQIALWITPGQIGSAPQAAALGWISTIGAFIALFAPPIVGALSDRTTSPWGRRRPWIALGVGLLLVGTWLLAIPNGLVALLIGLLIFQLGGNTATAGYQGLMPDLVPQEQRGASSGYLGIMTILGNACGLALAAYLLGDVGATTPRDTITHGLFLFYGLTGVVLAIGAAITLLSVHERPLAPGSLPEPSAQVRDRLAGWLTPWRVSGFRWVFLTRSAVMMGLSLFMTFIAYYFANVAHITNFVQATAVLAILALVGAAGSALTLGLASDRIGRVPLVCGATVCMATAAASFVILPQGTPLWPAWTGRSRSMSCPLPRRLAATWEYGASPRQRLRSSRRWSEGWSSALRGRWAIRPPAIGSCLDWRLSFCWRARSSSCVCVISSRGHPARMSSANTLDLAGGWRAALVVGKRVASCASGRSGSASG
jgi:MFS family permease